MEPVTSRLWIPRGAFPTSEQVTSLCRQLPTTPLLARLLLTRELTSETAQQFLEARLADLPDPFLLPDMTSAANRLVEAILRGEKVAVHGDYDVDGMTGTALLVEGLQMLGAAEVDYHIPLRLQDGYGLSGKEIEQTAAAGTKVVVSVDCGVSAHAEADLARKAGLDLIITDHHQPSATLPAALAVINPQRTDSDFPFRELAGVGVAFFLLIALRKQLRDAGWFAERQEPDLRNLLDLVALGTIADLVPLIGVNRTLTRMGLTLLDAGNRVGVRALKQVAAITDVSAGVVGYQLAPRLNAAGRLEDAGRGVALLLEKDMVSAMTIARHLDQCNRERREIEQETFKVAEAAVERLPASHTHAIVLAGQGWHSGVIGIVASRLVDRYYRPTILIALDGERGKGSARSIRGFHLFQGLEACAEHLEDFGGHAMAAGLSLSTEKVADFSVAMETHVRLILNDEDLIPKLQYDGLLLLEELDLPGVHKLAGLAPYGMGNPEPVFLVEGVRAMRTQVLKEQHLRFNACQGGYSHPAIAFGMAERLDELEGEVDLLVTPQVNHYRGRDSVQLRIRDFRKSPVECGA